MKLRALALITTALVCCNIVAFAEKYYTLSEIRKQATDGWHETYTDKFGRTRHVDIDIEVFGGENAPVLKICWGESPEIRFSSYGNNKSRSPLDDIAEAEMKRGGITTYLYESVRGMNVDFDQRYAEAYGSDLTVCEMVTFLKEVLQKQGNEQNYLWEQPCLFDLRYSKHKKTGEILVPPTYYLQFLQTEYGLPILSDVGRAFKRGIDIPICLPSLFFSMLDCNSYGCTIFDVDVQQILAENIPLCSIENVIEAAREMIENGYVYRVLSLKFGYVIYTDPDYKWNKRDEAIDISTWYLVPSWVMECHILNDPRTNKVTGNPNTKGLVINAQTGEMMDWFDTSLYGRGDGRYRGFISWEEIE